MKKIERPFGLILTIILLFILLPVVVADSGSAYHVSSAAELLASEEEINASENGIYGIYPDDDIRLEKGSASDYFHFTKHTTTILVKTIPSL